MLFIDIPFGRWMLDAGLVRRIAAAAEFRSTCNVQNCSFVLRE